MANRDSIRLEEVVYLTGQVLSVRADTLRLHVLQAYTADDRIRRLRPGTSVATVALGVGANLQVRHLDELAMMTMVIGVPVILLLTWASFAVPAT